ncbi:hypothetical protein ZWY2020_046274 [Hordeum vulgare]|nr:hypothetical protein ZWY2020_046274 [Hordeum vulgare]
MDKHTIRIAALALLSVHLLCSATTAQCRTIANGMDNDNINNVNLNCQRRCSSRCCTCCNYTDWCYQDFDTCDKSCPMLAAGTATAETVLTKSAVRTDDLMRHAVPNAFSNCHV